MTQHLFCFGYGYTASTLGVRLLNEGWRVSGTTTSQEKADALHREGINAIVWQMGDFFSLEKLDGVTHVLQSISPDAGGDPVIKFFGEQLEGQTTIQWAGYLSTTGVYGNHDGGWADESTPPSPTNKRSEYRLTAEQQWLDWGSRADVPTHIFRLSGIYGAYRNALSKVKAGEARRIQMENQYFSRIHVEDIATVLQASIHQPNAGAIYNLADDKPSSAADVTTFAAQLLGVEPPPLQTPDEANLSPMAMSFYKNSKRVRNHKIKDELGVTLAYPSYEEGLRQIYADGTY